MFLPKSWSLSGLRGIFLERPHQHVGAEDVNPHRAERDVRRSRHRRRLGGLLLKTDRRGRSSSMDDDAEPRCVRERHLEAGERGVGVPLDVKAQHLRVVHLVHVIARQHDDVARRFLRDGIQVLEDRVRGAEIPVLADPFLRRQDLDELAELLRHDVPAHADVAVERQRLVLGGDVDVPQPGVDAVAQGEVDDAVRPSEIDRGFRPFFGQWIQTLSRPAGEQDDEDIVEVHDDILCRFHSLTRPIFVPMIG